ncbi:hypothetical protein NMG60_11035302 [Bertholletia excelsa]
MDLDGGKEGKRRKCKIEDDQPKSGMGSLPHDVTLDIISRLPITSVLQFRFVSRAWNELSHNPSLVELQFLKTVKNNPCLLLHCDYPIRNELYFVELSDHLGKEVARKIRLPFQDKMPEFNVIASCNGLLCLSDSMYGDPLWIFNPFTRECKLLARSRQFDDQVVAFGFGFHPATKEYKVVKLVFYWNRWNQYDASPLYRGRRLGGHTESEVQVLSLKDTNWRSLGKVPFQLEPRAPEAAVVNGRLHWMARCQVPSGVKTRSIFSFDLGDEQFREVPKPDCGGLERCNYHLTVLGGCLSAVVWRPCRRFLEIWVMKVYGVKESWIKEFCIRVDYPEFIKKQSPKPYRIWKNVLNQRFVRVLCLLKNGNILIEYKGGILVSHDPLAGNFQKLMFEGMPDMFRTVVHVGSLNWIGTTTFTQTN